jgi:hypothetical protein
VRIDGLGIIGIIWRVTLITGRTGCIAGCVVHVCIIIVRRHVLLLLLEMTLLLLLLLMVIAVLTGVTYVAVDAIDRCARRHPHRITTSSRRVAGIGGMLLVLLLLLLLLLLWMIVSISTHHLSGLRRVVVHVDGSRLKIRRGTRKRTGAAVSSERHVLRRSNVVFSIERMVRST